MSIGYRALAESLGTGVMGFHLEIECLPLL